MGIVVQLAQGSDLTALPALFLPLAMLAIFLVITEIGYRAARSGWGEMARYLAQLLDARDGWTAQ